MNSPFTPHLLISFFFAFPFSSALLPFLSTVSPHLLKSLKRRYRKCVFDLTSLIESLYFKEGYQISLLTIHFLYYEFQHILSKLGCDETVVFKEYVEIKELTQCLRMREEIKGWKRDLQGVSSLDDDEIAISSQIATDQEATKSWVTALKLLSGCLMTLNPSFAL